VIASAVDNMTHTAMVMVVVMNLTNWNAPLSPSLSQVHNFMIHLMGLELEVLVVAKVIGVAGVQKLMLGWVEKTEWCMKESILGIANMKGMVTKPDVMETETETETETERGREREPALVKATKCMQTPLHFGPFPP